ncbi:MAG: DUF3037 domain-containing protein [Candidatus Acidiferrales bacterium]
MPSEHRKTLRYRVLRYAPNLIRDEWVNIGILLEEFQELEAVGGSRRAIKIIEEDREFARVRKLHPAADVQLLHSLRSDFESIPGMAGDDVRKYFLNFERTLSNALQLSSQKAVLADDFNTELGRLYEAHVAPPPYARGGIVESTRAWIRNKLKDVFHRHRISSKLKPAVRIDEFTHTGDPFKFDYGYKNGKRGYIHSVVLNRDAAQAKVLAYTVESIRKRVPTSEFTAVTEAPPIPGNLQHLFIGKLFEDQNIRIVPMNQVEKFAEELRMKLQ